MQVDENGNLILRGKLGRAEAYRVVRDFLEAGKFNES